MTTKDMKTYIEGKTQTPLNDDSDFLNVTSSQVTKSKTPDIFNAVNALNTVLVQTLADLPPLIGGVRNFGTAFPDGTVFEIGAPIVEGDVKWLLSTNQVIFSNSKTNSIITGSSGPFIETSLHNEITLRGLTIVSTGAAGAIGINPVTNDIITKRFIVEDCVFDNFETTCRGAGAFVRWINSESRNSMNHFDSLDCAIEFSNPILANQPAIAGSTYIKIRQSDPLNFTTILTSGSVQIAAMTGETVFDFDPSITSNLLINTGIYANPGQTPTIFAEEETGDITAIGNNGGFAQYTTSVGHSRQINDFVYIEGDCATTGAQKITARTGTTFTTDKAFVDTIANFVTFSSNLTERSSNVKVYGAEGLPRTRVFGINAINTNVVTVINTSGIFERINGTWSGHAGGQTYAADPAVEALDPKVNIMTRCEAVQGGKITYLGPTGRRIRVTYRGGTQDIGSADTVKHAIRLNGTTIKATSLGPSLRSGTDTTTYCCFDYIATQGDFYEAMCTNEVNLDAVANDLGSILMVENLDV